MRKRFEPQLILGQLPISETYIPKKNRDAMVGLMAALKEIFVNDNWNEKIFAIMESKITKDKRRTGRNGMDLWQIFVLSQVRLCWNISYDRLHYLVNSDKLMRQIMGVETGFGYERVEFEYQNIIDNVSLLDDQTVREINAVIVEMGHEVFKKKDTAALRLKTDSFVVKSNVHFPTDYNLLWDCARKCLDTVNIFLEKYPNIRGWRKISDWRKEIKGLMRGVGKVSSSGGKEKEKRMKKITRAYLNKSRALLAKLTVSKSSLNIMDKGDLLSMMSLEHFMKLLKKHIDLVERRLLKGEQIPHDEKLFSIFEEYTEWITKGKLHPNVELGKNTVITTDQFNLIVDYQVMEHQSDSEIVLPLIQRMRSKYIIDSWSFDKGFWHHENKSALQKEIPNVIMPKKGKRNQAEKEEESKIKFKRLKNKHSAIESNINELEHRGLDRCPDKGYRNFKRYIGLSVAAYNLRKIGKVLMQRNQEQSSRYRLCA